MVRLAEASQQRLNIDKPLGKAAATVMAGPFPDCVVVGLLSHPRPQPPRPVFRPCLQDHGSHGFTPCARSTELRRSKKAAPFIESLATHIRYEAQVGRMRRPRRR